MVKWISACAAAWVLVGCASAPPVQDAGQLAKTHGFVHATFPVHDPVDTLQGMPDATRLVAVGNSTEYRLTRTTAYGANAHGLWVPAGTYEVRPLKARNGGAYDTVVVEAGRVTDLGAIVPVPLGNDEVGVVIVQQAEVVAEREAVVAGLRPYLVSAEPIIWSPRVPPKATKIPSPASNMGLIGQLITEYGRSVQRAPLNAQLKDAASNDELLRLARTATVPATDEVAVGEDGAVYWGAALGQLRARAPDGTWSSVDTGTLQAITAVEMNAGRLVAGSDRGEILVGSPGRPDWRRVASLGADRTILDIDRVGTRWMVIAAEIKPAGAGLPAPQIQWFEVYTSTADDLSGLTLVHRQDKGFKSHVLNAQHGRGMADGTTYFVHGFDAEPLRVDLNTLAVSTPKSPTLIWMHAAADRSVLTGAFPGGGWTKVHLSRDHGTTWQQIDNPPYPIYDVQFESPTRGYATRWTRGGMFTSDLEFMTYDAARNTWVLDHTAPTGCLRPLRDARQIHQYCLTRGGSILNWVDGKWQPEFALN